MRGGGGIVSVTPSHLEWSFNRVHLFLWSCRKNAPNEWSAQLAINQTLWHNILTLTTSTFLYCLFENVTGIIKLPLFPPSTRFAKIIISVARKKSGFYFKTRITRFPSCFPKSENVSQNSLSLSIEKPNTWNNNTALIIFTEHFYQNN